MYVRKCSSTKMNIKKKYNLRSSCLGLSTELIQRVVLAGVAPGHMSQAKLTHRGSLGVTLTLVLFSLGMFPLLLFQGVSPVCNSCSWMIAYPRASLILGSSSGFLMGLVWVGGTPPPPPPPPPPPLPGILFLCGMVAHNYHPLHWTCQYKIQDGHFYQCSQIRKLGRARQCHIIPGEGLIRSNQGI